MWYTTFSFLSLEKFICMPHYLFSVSQPLYRYKCEVMEPCCLILEEEVAAAIKGLKIGKDEMMKASGGFGSRWMTDLINNIVKEGCIPDDWRKSILMPVYKGKCDPLILWVIQGY